MVTRPVTEPPQQNTMRVDSACRSVVAALEDDPFYRAICIGYGADVQRRRDVLTDYFSYSIQEAKEIGRCVHLEDRSCGVAVWLLPQAPEVRAITDREKRVFLQTTLRANGCANYYRMVEFMAAQAKGQVDSEAWYLSIVAVDPRTQGQGRGRQLLEPTLAEADGASAICYLETFNLRSVRFYERLGFSTNRRFLEPTTGAEYALMVRVPGAPRCCARDG